MTRPSGLRTGPAPRRPRLARWLLIVAAAVLLSACGNPSTGTVIPPALDGGPASSAPASPSPSSSSPSASGPARAAGSATHGPTVVGWGRDKGLLSVVVRNDERGEIVYGRVRVTALSKTGGVVLRTSGQRFSKATTILGLPAGRRYGLVLSLPPHSPAISSVQVTYVERFLRSTSAGPALRFGRPVLSGRRRAAVVTVPVSATGPVPPLVGAQAFLVDAHHRIVAVISGRFYCFASGTRRTLRMQLFRPVPPGTEVAKVVGYPVPRDAPLHAPAACR